MDGEQVAADMLVPRLLDRPEFQAMMRRRRNGRRRPFPPVPPEYWEYYYEPTVHREFPGILPIIYQVIKIASQALVLLLISSATYLLFYHFIMPTHFDETLYFDYTRAYNSAIHMQPPKRIRKEQTCNSPWAAVDLFAKKTSWEAQYEHVDPLPRIASGRRRLVSNQAYFVETRLQLPQSPVNDKVGMFGVVVELRATNGTLLAVSRRSTRLPHESAWIKTLANGFCIVPLLLGAVDESRTVTVPSYRQFVESPELPLQHVVVRIEVQAAAAASPTLLPEIVGGTVRVGKELNVFQELLKVWFYSCFAIGTMLIAFAYLMQLQILHFIWTHARQRYRQPSVTDEEFDFDVSLNFEDAELFPEDHYSRDADNNFREATGTAEQPRGRSESSSSWEDLTVDAQANTDDASFATPLQPDDKYS